MEKLKDKVILKEGESLKHERSFSQGFMHEEDVELYSIVRSDGTVSGTVKVTDHTAVNGFRRTLSVVQTDNEGMTVVDKSWRV